MQIGITYQSSSSLADSGLNQTAHQLMKIAVAMGAKVTMMDLCNADEPSKWNAPDGVEWKNAYQAREIDRLIDIDGRLSSTDRMKSAKEPIVFLRGFLQFSELESVSYIENEYLPRQLDHVKEIWCWDILNPESSLASVSLLFPCPIRRIPFVWSPLPSSGTSSIAERSTYLPELPWMVHVSEKNRMNQSTSVIPLVAIREIMNQSILPHGSRFLVHHMEHLQGNRFLKENVTDNLEIHQLPVSFVPSQSFQEWIDMPNQILLSHTRFLSLRKGLLHALFLGIPVIHNSPVLKDLHPSLKALYYTGNNITEMITALKGLLENPSRWYSSVEDVQMTLKTAYSWKSHESEWRALLVSSPSKAMIPLPQQPSQQPSQQPQHPSHLRLLFSDMWPGFNPMNNYFTDALRHEYPSMTVSGELYSPTNQTADLLLFGPYGNEWKTAPSHLPRIYFSAENWPVEEDPSIALYLTPSRKEDATHLRVPTWATFIDWFSGQMTMPKEGSDNPIRLPLHLAMTPHTAPFSQRSEFCGFVVSNPVCEFRNQTFLAVNEYKRVNSGGGLFNNIGERLELKYPGGGCGDISKHHFFAKHRFTLSFENSQSSGYITEKVLHAKMAGCLPLYWGDQDTDLDFAPHSLINLSAIQNDPQRVVQLLKKLEENPSLCEKMASTPILNEEKKEKALHQMSLLCKRLMDLASSKPLALTAAKPLAQKETVERIYVINLPHREDRWATFQASQPAWDRERVERVRAVDGKKLELNPMIYQLFEHNEFQWKKSVMGCSMSHLSVWTSIQSRTTDPEGTWYLILEDDVRFQPDGWSLFTNTLSKEIPSDAEVLYLGGVLPPNQPALPLALEPVTAHWSRIKPNRFFSPIPAPFFHFCAYSYLLTKKGARKLLQGVLQSKRKAYTGIDHLINHPQYGLSVYIATPLITSCFQEEDPAYVQSNFNDLARKDQFDSDIWNNTECFTEKELAPFQCPQKKGTFTVYYEPSEDGSPFDLYERKWLEFLFEKEISFEPYHEPVRDAWYLVQRPHSEKWNQRFAEFHQQGTPFRVLHLSDEFLSDTIDFYWLPECKAVIRNYPREMPSKPHILTIPLGYHHVPSVESQKRTFQEREWIWSFHGTDWFRRGQQLEAFRSFVPHRCHLQPEWNHSTMTKESQYLSHLTNSKFCPILKGNHYETFRLYEALEAGVIPVTTITDMSYLSWMDDHLHLEELYPWNKPLVMFKRSEEDLESLRQSIQARWTAWKKKIQSEVRLLL